MIFVLYKEYRTVILVVLQAPTVGEGLEGSMNDGSFSFVMGSTSRFVISYLECLQSPVVCRCCEACIIRT